jgi:Hint module
MTTGLSAPTEKPVFALPTRAVTAAPVRAKVSTALPTYAAVDGLAPLTTAAPTQSAIAPTIAAPTSQETGVPSFVVIIKSPTEQKAATAPESQPANTCFAGSERVTLESGRSKVLSDVRVGDSVLVADAAGKTSFSQVRRG